MSSLLAPCQPEEQLRPSAPTPPPCKRSPLSPHIAPVQASTVTALSRLPLQPSTMQQLPLLSSEHAAGVSVGRGDGGWSPQSDRTVLTQPGLGLTTTTLTTITQTGGDWSTGLCDVCSDSSTCLLGAFLPCCLDMSLAHQFGECWCLPLLPASTFAMRVGIRERFKIRGSVYEDWTTVCFCYPLALCQMFREMKRRLKSQMYTVSTVLECS